MTITLSKRTVENNLSIAGYCFLVIFMVLGISYSFFMYVALLLAVLMVFFEKSITKQLALLMFLLPFSNLFVRGNYGGYPYLLLVMILTVIKLAMKLKRFQIAHLLCTLLCVIDVSLMSMSGISIPLRGQFAVCGILLVATIAAYKEKFDIMYLSRVYAFAVLTAIVLALCKDFIPNMSNYTYDKYLALGMVERFCGLYKNPNYFTFDITIAVTGLLYVSSMRKKMQMLDFILAIVLCVCGCLSVSMSFVLSILVTLICFFMFSKEKSINYKAILITLAAACILYNLFKNAPVLSVILERMSSFDLSQGGISSTTTNRSDIWIDFLNRIMSDLKVFLFGAGMNAASESAHNFYIEYWYFFGLLGVILFLMYITTTAFRAKKSVNRANFNKQLLILIIPIMFRALGISLMAFMNFWLALCFIIAMLKYNESKI